MTGSTKRHALVIEDNPLNLELVTDLLEAGGYAVLSATTAERGIEVAVREQPDFVLMDISLPGMDGLAATRRLANLPQTARIPVLAVSSHAMPGDAERALAAGCIGYITKPLETRTFIAQVEAILSQHARTPKSEP